MCTGSVIIAHGALAAVFVTTRLEHLAAKIIMTCLTLIYTGVLCVQQLLVSVSDPGFIPANTAPNAHELLAL